jgi:hypothetical protein
MGEFSVPLSITKQEHAPTCTLSTWVVTDAVNFVDVLAWLYLRKPSHAARIMNNLNPGSAGFPGRVFENAIKLLCYEISDIAADLASPGSDVAAEAKKICDARVALRDGLLFQHVSWVAATIQFPGAAACPPHVRKADKGFDGLLIEIDPQTAGISRLVLCEDKASVNPRSLVTGKIWPEREGVETFESLTRRSFGFHQRVIANPSAAETWLQSRKATLTAVLLAAAAPPTLTWQEELAAKTGASPAFIAALAGAYGMDVFDLDRRVVSEYSDFARSFTKMRSADIRARIDEQYSSDRF